MTPESTQALVIEETSVLFMNWFPDIIGCFGTVIVLVAYILLQSRRLHSHNLLFSFLNLVGGLMILVSLLYCWNLAAVAMEVSWIIISAFGIIKAISPHGLPWRRRRFVKKDA